MQLLERESHLGALREHLESAKAGAGRLVLIGGEAGVGKTALVQCFCDRVEVHAEVFVGSCDPLSTPRPLGPLLDIAHRLDRRLTELLQSSEREAVFRRFLECLSTASNAQVIVFEDIHWADEATFDLLQFLGRRISACRVLVVATYRQDEVGHAHPLRAVLGHLATTPSVQRLTLSPFSQTTVAELAKPSGLDPVELYRRTGGNPFFLTEILNVPEERLPATVRDVVLSRVAQLSAAGRRNLEVASVIGMRVEPWLLAELVGDAVDAADECLAVGMLRASGTLLAFRHELARDAFLGTLSPQRRLTLNREVLAVLRATPTLLHSDGLARLAHHAEEARDTEAVLEYAPAAAKRAAQLKAHREAAAQYERALRFAHLLPMNERADLLEAMSYECYLVGNIESAITASREALDLRRDLDDSLNQGKNLRWLSRLFWYSGDQERSVETARAATEVLEREAPGIELAWAYSNLSQSCMLQKDEKGAVLWGERAISLARQLGNIELEVHALTNIGTAQHCQAKDEGRDLLEKALLIAREHDFEDHVSRIYTNLASGSVKSRQLQLTERYVQDGLTYCDDCNLFNCGTYMRSYQVLVLLYQGRWDEAAEVCSRILAEPYLPAVSQVNPLVVLGTLRARRGDPGVRSALSKAYALATATEELQRLVPVAVAMAEAAWLGNEHRDEVALLRRCYDMGLEVKDAWYTGEVAYWRWKLGDTFTAPDWLAQPYLLHLNGEWQKSADIWTDLGLPYEAALALAEADDEAALQRAHAEFRRLGATATTEKVEHKLYTLGFNLRSGPRRATLTNPARLTQRQFQILKLMAEGLSNAEIAGKLYRSTKTVDHHVSAVLAKLEVQNRTEAVRKALEENYL